MITSTPPIVPLPLTPAERPRPEIAVPATAQADRSGQDSGRGNTGTPANAPQQAAGLFSARIAKGPPFPAGSVAAQSIAAQSLATAPGAPSADGTGFPPLDTRVVGDEDVIDPQRPTARVPDPLVSIADLRNGTASEDVPATGPDTDGDAAAPDMSKDTGQTATGDTSGPDDPSTPEAKPASGANPAEATTAPATTASPAAPTGTTEAAPSGLGPAPADPAPQVDIRR